jgi:hypothetical protein
MNADSIGFTPARLALLSSDDISILSGSLRCRILLVAILSIVLRLLSMIAHAIILDSFGAFTQHGAWIAIAIVAIAAVIALVAYR